MKDVQKLKPQRPITINRVGIKKCNYPMAILRKDGDRTNTTALISVSSSLNKYFKGTHMSRFIEVLNEYKDGINPKDMSSIVNDIKERLEVKEVFFEMEFKYFVKKIAPVSGILSWLGYTCIFGASFKKEYESILQIEVPIMSVCPCSKEISDAGAHNQRCYTKVKVKTNEKFMWIEDLITIIEGASSSEVFSLLKREDEKYITEQSYAKPMFVEDIVRELGYSLSKQGFDSYVIQVKSNESIHDHEAFAEIIRGSFH
jgi:GTP cyclohydrolase I